MTQDPCLRRCVPPSSSALLPVLMAVLLLPCLSALPAAAYTNENGVILLHGESGLVYTTENVGYCGMSTVVTCTDVVGRTDDPGTVILYALAAFPSADQPDVDGLAFGITYGEGDLVIPETGSCGDSELATDDWPASGSGAAVVWATTQTDTVFEFYWFAAYWYYADRPTALELGPHPTQGGVFVGSGPLSPIDDIADFGSFGFGMDGYVPCPDGPVPTRDATWGSVKKAFR